METYGAGLEGVVAAATGASEVDGERGALTIAGFAVQELAPRATFEEVVWLLWHGRLPTRAELEDFAADLAGARELPGAARALLADAASRRVDSMDALRMAAGTLSLDAADAPRLVAAMPTMVAAYWRLGRGLAPLPPRRDLGHAANFLYMLAGETPDAERVRALDTYLNTVVDHGLNASTFTVRVITSTGSDLVSAVVGGLGALKGPLHGGAPGPALDMVFEIGAADRAEPILRAKLARGERLMGFGHRVYKVRDPRADVLAAAAERLFTRGGDMTLYRLARDVEAVALRLLEEQKPGRRLQTNVEFYTALVLHGLGFDVPLFTPTFAVSRVAGWIGHAREQQRANRLIRPQSTYVGPRDRHWVAIGDRVETTAGAA
ncbi:MAG TPA: citrate synthase/methylcitrate synthase [Vicinamibacterales bacterium]|nr:citrate synthase/methylcitrate synthase [Vicinamibacterales bacterium]